MFDEHEIRTFVYGTTRYFEVAAQQPATVGSPYLVTQGAPETAEYTGIINITGRRNGIVYFTAPRGMLIVMLMMMLGTIVQIALWGVLFVVLGEFDELYEATYHSAVNFASLGYGDIVMSKPWKLLGPLEACCGVLMLGMTAAALMAILQQMIQTQREALKP